MVDFVLENFLSAVGVRSLDQRYLANPGGQIDPRTTMNKKGRSYELKGVTWEISRNRSILENLQFFTTWFKIQFIFFLFEQVTQQKVLSYWLSAKSATSVRNKLISKTDIVIFKVILQRLQSFDLNNFTMIVKEMSSSRAYRFLFVFFLISKDYYAWKWRTSLIQAILIKNYKVKFLYQIKNGA